MRPFLGILLAPVRRRDRAEVRIYVELGAAFTAAFLLMDAVPDVLAPLLREGAGSLAPTRLAALWLQKALMTFVVIYAFAAPIGAVLTLYLLTRPTHTVPRLLAGLTVLAMAMGAGVVGFS